MTSTYATFEKRGFTASDITLLKLDGVSVTLYRYVDKENGDDQLFVSINTEESAETKPLRDHDAKGEPYICVTLNDATIYDHERGAKQPAVAVIPARWVEDEQVGGYYEV